MRIATMRVDGGTVAVRVEGDTAVELGVPDVGALVARRDWASTAAAAAGPRHAYDETRLAPVVVDPGKIICLGLNYRAHIEETLREVPQYPTLFAKYADALIGPRDAIELSAAATGGDWEVELAFVIGRTVRDASPAAALDAIAGYTICNDVTMRDWQRRTLQWLQGKTFEHTTPIGPVLVTPDEVDHARDLALSCEVDGELMQSARTSDMVFTPADIVAYASTIVTLRPGDLISTGTPAGIGEARTPPVFLRPGQVVRTVIEGIGELVNPCVAG